MESTKPLAAAANSFAASGSSSSFSFSSTSHDAEAVASIGSNPVKVSVNHKFSSSGGSSSSSDDGFVSGEEEFETAHGRPIVAGIDEEDVKDAPIGDDDEDEDADVGGVVGDASFVAPSGLTTPGSFRPVAKISNDDDDDDEEEDGGLDEPKFKDFADSFRGDGEVEPFEGGVGVSRVSVTASNDSWKVVGVGGLRELGELVEASGGDRGGREYIGEALMGLRQGKAIESEGIVAGSEGPGSETREIVQLQSAEVVEEQAAEALVGQQSEDSRREAEAISTLEMGSVTAGREDDKPVETDGVKFTVARDMAVDAIRVDVTKSNAAIVGEVGDRNGSEIEALELPRGAVNLENGFDQISQHAEDPADIVVQNLHEKSNGQLGSCTESMEEVPGLKKDDVSVVGRDLGAESSVAVVDEATKYPHKEVEQVTQTEPGTDSEAKVDETATRAAAAACNHVLAERDEVDFLSVASVVRNEEPRSDDGAKNLDSSETGLEGEERESEHRISMESLSSNRDISMESGDYDDDDDEHNPDEHTEIEGLDTDGEKESMVFESSEAAQQFLEELQRGAGSQAGAEGSHDHSQKIDGQIVTDSDEEVDTDEDGNGKELFDSAALAALLKAATGADTDAGNITITSQDGSRLFSVERPAGLGSSLRSLKPSSQPGRRSLFPSGLTTSAESESSLTEEEKKKLEKIQQLRVKFLRLVQRLGYSPEDQLAAQVLYRLSLIAGRQAGQSFNLDSAKRTASELELEKKDDLNFSLNILVLGKAGVGKSATINSLLGEDKTFIHAFEPATTAVKEIRGTVGGVKIRIFDTPGLKSSIMEQNENRKIFSSITKFTKKCPPDIVLYVDRLDTQTRDLNDLPLLKSITSALGPSIWRSAIVTLTHSASAPPDGPSGAPLSYDVFVTQRSHVVQQSIGQAVGDLRLMNPSLMNPVSLVENHPSCRKNRDGEKVLPNGQTWRPQLLMLCYSMKILAEASSLSKPQDPFDHRKLFGFRVRSPPLPYLLSWLLQSRTHPKLASDQGLDNGDSDIDMADISDSDEEDEEDEYDQLPPFKPLRKSQIAKLSKEQRKAYFEEYDYRVKLLQKKQLKEELRRMREIKKKGNVATDEYGYMGEDAEPENGSPAAVPVPLHDMVLPPSFDSDNPAYRYRFLEPTSQFIARPVLDTHGWDHDCGYDGVNLEQGLAIADRFPGAVTVQITKDKKEFNLHLDSSLAVKHGENGSTMAGFDIQNIGKQLAYIVRGESKFKNFRKNKTAAGFSVTFLGENVATGFKVEDQIALGKRVMLVGSAGTVRSNSDSAYGANLEVRLREADYPVAQDQSSLGLSLVKWRGDLALGANFQSQISVGRSSKIAVRAGLNNKLSGQITVRTSSSEQLQIALVGILPIMTAIYKSFRPGVSENYSLY